MTVTFDPSIDIPTPGTVETLTITFPIGDSANTTNATLIGSGFISSVSQPTVDINGLLEMQITFAFDGDSASPPTYSAEAA